MDQVPSDEAIREMDGPALTLLAYKLGLAPARSIVYEHTTGQRGVVMFLQTRMAQWEPHTDIDHANAAWRQLRGHGWLLSNSWLPARCPDRRGYLEAMRGMWHIGAHYTEDTEARAVLLTCVLAMAHEQRTERSTQRDNLL